MSPSQLAASRRVGVALVIGAALVNVPYGLLIARFDYPDVLRAPPEEILSRFQASGPELVWIWLAFAWVGLPLFYALPNLSRVLFGDDAPSTATKTATAFGVLSLALQMIGLLRWVFVVPVLARLHEDGDPATRAAARVAFEVVLQYGGVVVGEHLGQAFTSLWLVLLGAALVRHGVCAVGGLGVVAGLVYSVAQLELLHTVLPAVPLWEPAGLVGSLLWLAFLISLGVHLLRRR